MRRGAPRSSKGSLIVILLLIVVLSVGLIGASPLALDAFRGSTSHWNRLSAFGQTYGAASAILSVLAVLGVADTGSPIARLQSPPAAGVRKYDHLSMGDVLRDAYANG
jgi:hypothetical protein